MIGLDDLPILFKCLLFLDFMIYVSLSDFLQINHLPLRSSEVRETNSSLPESWSCRLS